MNDCGFCKFYVSGTDEYDNPCMICNNPSSFRYRDFVCINDTCSRFFVHPSLRSCENCVHSVCSSLADREACLDCYGPVTNFSEFVLVPFPSVEEKSGVPAV